MTWQNVLRCAGGSKTRLKKCQIFSRMWFSDEAHFSLSGHVNSKNSVFRGSEAPDEVLQRPLHSANCTAWVAISRPGIIGPFWFGNDFGETVTVNKERYTVVLNKFWRALGARRSVRREEQWFQQDGATTHTANIIMEWLDRRFADRLISRRRVPEWSPHSPPDLRGRHRNQNQNFSEILVFEK